MSDKKPARASGKPGKGKKKASAAHKAGHEPSPVVFVDRLSQAFADLEQRIRDRAYHIFLDRGEDEGDPVADWLSAQMEMVAPVALEVKEQKKNIVVEANLKGFEPKDIEVEVEGNQLRVFGSHTESKHQRGGKQASEHSMHFYQSIALPDSVDADEAKAKLFKNGKLKITLPRAGA